MSSRVHIRDFLLAKFALANGGRSNRDRSVLLVSFCGGSRNRTHVCGFGDRSPATERCPQPNTLCVELRLFEIRMLPANLAVLLELKLAGHQLLILRRIIHTSLADRTLHFD